MSTPYTEEHLQFFRIAAGEGQIALTDTNLVVKRLLATVEARDSIITELNGKLEQISGRHFISPSGKYCAECGEKYPCRTRKLIDG